MNIRTLIAAGLLMMTQLSAASTFADRFGWLVGTWTQTKGNTTLIEEWKMLSDDTLRAKGYLGDREGGHRKGTETILLTQMGGEVFYIAKAPQNDLPVSFRLVSASENNVAFENPSHDFPKRIEYSLRPDGALVANVTGAGDRGFSLVFEREEAAEE